MLSNFINIISGTNETSFLAYNILYGTLERNKSNNNNHNNNHDNTRPANGIGSQQIATILQQIFYRITDNQSTYIDPLNANFSSSSSTSLMFPTSFFAFDTYPVSSTKNTDAYHVLSFISLLSVLLINPIVILFGVTGNILATYILIHCNIVKLPVSFYTVMLNISDTLNLLIPVFIFWLDNCLNRKSERGYFRDRSNFLCKILMCPDQLFAALSAWYMCAISFNRWYSVCRPSSFFFRTKNIENNNQYESQINREPRKRSSNMPLISFGFPLNCLCFSANSLKVRQHLQAFRSIAFITFCGILCCLYPIFMNELQPIVPKSGLSNDLNMKNMNPYSIDFKRCNYNRNHQNAYDIIGITLSCFLHILPLTFVAAMNIMIIIRLKQRQRLMSVSTNLLQQSNIVINRLKKPSINHSKRSSLTYNSSIQRKHKPEERTRISSQPTLITTRRDQATSTDLSIQTTSPCSSSQNINLSVGGKTPKRHHSRDRTITIMLVGVALSYLILTLPYRLFWSYNVYIKRMHPEKLTSTVYLLKMHYIDHLLRTIRNIHYGTNFIFFIFLSKTFRRKFRQIFLGKFIQLTNHIFHRKTSATNSNHGINMKSNRQRRFNIKLEQYENSNANNVNLNLQMEHFTPQMANENITHNHNTHLQGNQIIPTIELERNNL